MPLEKGNSRAVIGRNIHEMQNSGHPHAQAVAAALHTADQSSHMAKGGLPHPVHDEQDKFHGTGLFHSAVPGRTDRLPRTVPADSFVFPADVVSGAGQGNTMAGAAMIEKLLNLPGPYGNEKPRADGGNTGGTSKVIVAGGETLANPIQLKNMGHRMRQAGKSKAKSDLAAGHEWARNFVTEIRKHQKKFLRNAPPPKK